MSGDVHGMDCRCGESPCGDEAPSGAILAGLMVGALQLLVLGTLWFVVTLISSGPQQ